jgi:hypothetical protein
MAKNSAYIAYPPWSSSPERSMGTQLIFSKIESFGVVALSERVTSHWHLASR